MEMQMQSPVPMLPAELAQAGWRGKLAQAGLEREAGTGRAGEGSWAQAGLEREAGSRMRSWTPEGAAGPEPLWPPR